LSAGCYWERLWGFSGELGDIITNEFTYSQSIVTISSGDLGFRSERCGTSAHNRRSRTCPLACSYHRLTLRLKIRRR
jgi:hypothetical protein